MHIGQVVTVEIKLAPLVPPAVTHQHFHKTWLREVRLGPP